MSYTKTNTGMAIELFPDGFELTWNGEIVLKHSSTKPFVYIGYGEEEIDMYRGNFDIRDYVIERTALRYVKTLVNEDGTVFISLSKYEGAIPALTFYFKLENGQAKLQVVESEEKVNR
jgi:alpha-glucosidase